MRRRIDEIEQTIIDLQKGSTLDEERRKFLIELLKDHKETSLKLKKNEEFLRQFRMGIENSGEAVFITNVTGEITYVNPSFEIYYGYSREEAIGKTPRIIKSNLYSPEFYENLWRKLLSGKVASGEMINKRKDGSLITIDFSTNPIINEGGDVIGFLAIQHDISLRKRMEKQLQESLKEKETLLAEVHHRVKNNLAVVSGLLLLQLEEEGNEAITDKLMDSVIRIKTMATIHEQLYQSNSFSRLDFADNLKSVVKNIVDTFQTNLQVGVDFDCRPVQLNINQAIPFSLIVNEVVTNIMKHAFKGRETGQVYVSLTEGTRGMVKLVISDNGVGLPENFDATGNQTLGLHLIDLLSKQLGAKYAYSRKGGSGVSFVISFEKAEKKGSGNAHMRLA